jgi:hypothetical protein
MRRPSIFFLILILAVTSAPFMTGFAQSDDENHLLDMLSYIPDTPETRQPQNYINYVDFEANQMALNTDIFALYDLTGTFWVFSLNRVQWAGAAYFAFQLDHMADVVGFSWRDVNRLLEAGNPRDVLVVYEGNFDTGAIDAALTARDFASEERDGVSVWHRYEDGEANFQDTEEADPFYGHLGSSARIADYGEQLIFARDWPIIEGANAARTNNTPSLADADDYRTLAEAVNSEGILIRAIILPEDITQQLLFSGEEITSMQEGFPEAWNIHLEDWGTLPPPSIAALADQQQGNDQVNIIALVYDDATTAQTAAQEIATRLQSFDPALYEPLGVTIDAPRVHIDDSGFAVALASVRYPLILDIDPETDEIPAPGQLMLRWQQMLFRLEFVMMASNDHHP